MSMKLLNNVTSIGVSRAVRLSSAVGVNEHVISAHIVPTGVAAPTAVTISLQGSTTHADAISGVVTPSGLLAASSGANSGIYIAIGSTFLYIINNVNYSAALATAGQAFSAAHVIGNSTDDVYGCINIYINSAGTISTQVPTSPQLYTTAALAYAAANAIVTDIWLAKIGYILIRANAKTWTANTSNFTSGLTSVQFISESSSFRDLLVHQMTPAELADGRFWDSIKGLHIDWVRMFLSVLTGTAIVNGRYTPRDNH